MIADAAKFRKGMDDATSATKGFSKSMSGMAKMAALGAGAAGIGAAIVALKGVVGAAQESEAAESRLTAAFDAVKISAKDRALAAEAVSATSRTAALDDEALSDVLAKLTRSTGDVTKAQEGMALAADIARARNISLEAAGKVVERGLLGNEAAFRKVGVEIGKGTTATEAFELAQAKFAGAAEAHGKTAAGAQEKLGVAFENLQEKIGQKLLPVLTDLANKLIEFVTWAEENWPRFQAAMEPVFEAAKKFVQGLIDKVKIIVSAIEGVIKVIQGIKDGDWSLVWEGLKQVGKAQIDFLVDVVLAIPRKLAGVAKDLAEKALDAIKTEFTNLAGWARDKIGDAAGYVAGLPGKITTALGEKLADLFGAEGAVGKPFAALVTFVSEKIAAIVKFFRDLPGNVAEAVSAGAEKVKDAVVGVFKGLPGFIKDILGISSPSKVFERIGEAIIQGAIKGIQNKAGALIDAAWDAFGKIPDIGGGTVSVGGGLVNRVLAALAYARLHGWQGEVTSGFRSSAEQAALYARYVNSGYDPRYLAAKPGTSSHESGQAVDVTDYGTFGAIMAGAPAGIRLYNRLGGVDPVHFSVSGYDKGGWLMPGVTLAANMTGRPEYISPPGAGLGSRPLRLEVPVYLDGQVITRVVRDNINEFLRANPRSFATP